MHGGAGGGPMRGSVGERGLGVEGDAGGIVVGAGVVGKPGRHDGGLEACEPS